MDMSWRPCRHSPMKVSAKHLWNAPQYTHHGNKIWKSWHRGWSMPPKTELSLDLAPPEHTMPEWRQWIIWLIPWGHLHLHYSLAEWLWTVLATLRTNLHKLEIYHCPNLNLWQSWYSLYINCSTSPWCFNCIFSSPAQWRSSVLNYASVHWWPCAQHRENQTSPWPCCEDIPTFDRQESSKLEV